MLRSLASNAFAVIIASVAHAQTPPLSVPPDSTRWDLQGQAKVAESHGRQCLLLDGGAAVLKDFEMRDGILDVDVTTSATRGFFGFDFRIDADGANGVDIPKDEWFHLRLEVSGAQAKLYVKDMDRPALVMDDLKSNVQKGQIALYDLTGATCFANFTVTTMPDAEWRRHLSPMPPGTLTAWRLSPALDALARNLEKPLGSEEIDGMAWEEVQAEPPGFVVLSRYRDAPHPRVTFANDFSKRLEPQPGMKVVYARARIDADRDQVRKLYIGYSDDVSVFLSGQILFRGRSAQNFRDPGFLGIVSADDDAVYLPLKKGANELLVAVSELGGGWGFVCRLADLEN